MAEPDITQMRKFVSPEIIFGVGARLSAANYAKTFGAKKVLIVSDPGVKAAGWLSEIENLLSGHEINWASYIDVSPNPRVEEVMKGAEFYLAEQCNMIVAIGGGSPMDCAKGIGIVATNGGDIRDFKGVDSIYAPIPPLVFIPTTSGTSADVSQFAIISDQQERFKFSIISKAIVPDVALVDPKTASTMDPFLTACTGLDALVHAVEAFVSTGAGPLTDMYALDAIRLIYRNLPLLIDEPDDMQLREQVMLGSMKAGLAFSNAILGAVHAMSHSLGGYLDLPHGLCNAMLLEHVIAYNFPNAEDRFKIIAQEMNIDIRGLTSDQVMRRLVQQVTLLKQHVGMSQTMSINGVALSDIPVLSEKALSDPCLITNPRPSNKRDLEVVYEEAL